MRQGKVHPREYGGDLNCDPQASNATLQSVLVSKSPALGEKLGFDLGWHGGRRFERLVACMDLRGTDWGHRVCAGLPQQIPPCWSSARLRRPHVSTQSGWNMAAALPSRSVWLNGDVGTLQAIGVGQCKFHYTDTAAGQGATRERFHPVNR